MKALHVIPAVAARYGGPSEAIVGMCRALGSAGVEARIATTDADGDGRLDVPIGHPVDFHGVPTTFFPRVGGDGFKRSPALAAHLREAVRAVDVVHVHAVFSHSSLAAARASRRAGVPYVVRPLGTLDPWSLAQKPWRKRVLLWTSVGSMLDGASAIHFTTDDERARAPRRARARALVIPLGLDDAVFRRQPRPAAERDLTIVAMTRLHPKKNLEGLIRAFASLPSRGEAWRLVIAGDGDPRYRATLEALAASSGARVTFSGWVSGEGKDALLATASLFALPSHQENFGIAVLEALAHGVPAIISDRVNLAPEISAAGAGWVTRDDADLARVLDEAIASADARQQCGACARALSERYRWPAIGRTLADAYTRIVTGASLPVVAAPHASVAS
jgi:glycosyltransferase involved in cell wall biosynthesis